MTTTPPNLVYYRACEGAWRAPVRMTVTDRAALRASGMGLLDRLGLLLLSVWPRWLGRPFMDTTVCCEPDGVVTHTTVVRWMGLPLQKSAETFTLDPDGRRFTVSGGMTGEGSVDETGTEAEYHLTWLGAALVQRTVRDGDRVTVRQEGPGFRGLQALDRQR